MSIQFKLIFTGVVFLLIVMLGYWLHHLDKPYPISWLTIHKLLSLAVLAFLVRTLLQNGALESMGPARTVLLTGTAALWIFTILSGGLLSMERSWPRLMSFSHQILPYLTLGVTIWCLYEVLIKEHPL